MDEKSKIHEEFGVEREGRRGLQVPPVIVKGGSMDVEFTIEGGFDAPEHGAGKKIKLAKHPKDTTITVIEVRDRKKKLLNSYTLPEDLEGKCLVYVWDDE